MSKITNRQAVDADFAFQAELDAHAADANLHGSGWTLVGAVNPVGRTSVMAAAYGLSGADSGSAAAVAGQVRTLSITLASPRTAGTITASILINGVQHGETVVINAATPNQAVNSVVFATPPSIPVNGVLTIQTSTTDFAPNNTSAVLTATVRNT